MPQYWPLGSVDPCITPANGQLWPLWPMDSPASCSVQFSNLGPSSPPYSCETSVNTSGVIDFSEAWSSCTVLTSFPCLATKQGTNFYGAWADCSNLATFSSLDLRAGVNFENAWNGCSSLTAFPTVNFCSGANFTDCWRNCTSLTSFPLGMFDNCNATDFQGAWHNCALDQISVDGILTSIDLSGGIGGYLSIDGGTSSPPGPSGLASKASLETKGWTVEVNTSATPGTWVRQLQAYPLGSVPEAPWSSSQIASDDLGNIYVIIRYPAIAPNPTSWGWASVTKFSESGVLEWSVDINKDIGIGNGFALNGSVIRAGDSQLIILAAPAYLSETGTTDPCFLLSLDPLTGSLIWAKSLEVDLLNVGDSYKFQSVFLNSQTGNIYISLQYQFGSGPLSSSPAVLTLSSSGIVLSGIIFNLDATYLMNCEIKDVLTRGDGSVLAFGNIGTSTGGLFIESNSKGFLVGLSANGDLFTTAPRVYGPAPIPFTSNGIRMSRGVIANDGNIAILWGDLSTPLNKNLTSIDPATGSQDIKMTSPYLENPLNLQVSVTGEIVVTGCLFQVGGTPIDTGWPVYNQPNYPNTYTAVYASDLGQMNQYRESGVSSRTENNQDHLRTISVSQGATGRFIGAPQYKDTYLMAVTSSSLDVTPRRFPTIANYPPYNLASYAKFGSATSALPVATLTGDTLPITSPSLTPTLASATSSNYAASVTTGISSIEWEYFSDGGVVPCDQPPFLCDVNVNPYCVTDFNGAWFGCSSLTSFPLLDVSSGTSFFQTWQGCSSLTSFPLLDVSSGVNFFASWSDCQSLVSFPALDVSSGASFREAWYNCNNLVSFPPNLFDTCSSGDPLAFSDAWKYCALDQTSVDNILISLDNSGIIDKVTSLAGGTSAAPGIAGDTAKISLIAKGWTVSVNSPAACDAPPYFCNTSVNPYCVTDFTDAWSGCYYLATFPALDTSSGLNFYHSWFNCFSLTSFPVIDVSSGTDFNASWGYCSGLTAFPSLDFSSATNLINSWVFCSNLASFPSIPTSSVTNFGGTWFGCGSLTSFPPLDVSSGTYFAFAWGSCSNLTSFPPNMFDSCSAPAVPSPMFGVFYDAWSNCALDQTSVDNILVSLDASGIINESTSLSGGTSSAPGPLGSSAKASLQAKGWTITTN